MINNGEYDEYLLLSKYQLILKADQYKKQTERYLSLLKVAKSVLEKTTYVDGDTYIIGFDLCAEIDDIINRSKEIKRFSASP